MSLRAVSSYLRGAGEFAVDKPVDESSNNDGSDPDECDLEIEVKPFDKVVNR